jgi:hypothetical protein
LQLPVWQGRGGWLRTALRNCWEVVRRYWESGDKGSAVQKGMSAMEENSWKTYTHRSYIAPTSQSSLKTFLFPHSPGVVPMSPFAASRFYRAFSHTRSNYHCGYLLAESPTRITEQLSCGTLLLSSLNVEKL